MKKIVTIIIAIAVIVGAFFFFRSGDKKVTTYETVELKKGSINNTVTATGTIEPTHLRGLQFRRDKRTITCGTR